MLEEDHSSQLEKVCRAIYRRTPLLQNFTGGDKKRNPNLSIGASRV